MNLFPIIITYISIISPYILDITDSKVGLIVFVKSHIPSRRLNEFNIPSNIQIILFEINLRKVVSCINLQRSIPEKKIFFWYLESLLKFYWTRYEKVIILGNFNKEAENKGFPLGDFLKGNGASYRDLLIKTSKVSFMTTYFFETGLSGHQDTYYSQNKIWKSWTEEINISQFQTIW